MAMKIEATKELVQMIERSAREWKRIKPILEEKHRHYDTYAEDMFGINVDFGVFDNKVAIIGAQIIDDEKYVNFLLRYGDMPNE
jgi:uncharacterized lipoprotein YehR (DUF1307 family)